VLSDSEPTGTIEFDLRPVMNRLNVTLRQLRASVYAAVVFMSVLMAIFAFLALQRLLDHASFPALFLVTLAIIEGMGALILRASAKAIRKKQPAGERIRITPETLEVVYPGGFVVKLGWGDPKFSVELHDFSDRDPARPITMDSPYAIRVLGRDSTLTPEAFKLILFELERRDLLRESQRFNWFPADAKSVVIYRAYSKSGRA
jgi:hypothetical protein